MTLYEFRRLPEKEQYNITFNIGTFMDHSFKGDQKFSLYAVQQFFVQVEYCKT